MFELSGKTALVTGSATGLGQGIAAALARQGAKVILSDKPEVSLEESSRRVEKEAGRAPAQIPIDVRDLDQVARGAARALEQFGRIDILVNNAGIIRQSAVVDTPEDEWDLIIRNNLKSVFLCSKEAGRRLIAQKRGGRIIAISSIHAVLSEPNCGHYTAAKGGIEAFCRTLATELAPHKVTVNFIRPGATYTELTTPMYTESVVRSLFERVPLKEIAKAEWIAAGAVFLASDDSRYMTGQHLTIDGGYVMDGSLPGAKYWEK
jgi:NAD(P)-dependent dehydrogenase (short-subunit alcohol dehydrogenase family)